MTRKQKFFVLCVCLFLFRCAFLFVGFDRLPMLPTLGDEVILNDPAVSLAQTGHFVCSSFPHSPLQLDQWFGHHPPVFFLMQAVIFRLFGLSALTLRIVGMLSAAMVPVLCVSIILELCERKLVDFTTVLLLAPVLFFDATTITYGRWARMESLADVFVLLALWLLLCGPKHTAEWRSRCLAGTCMGLAFGTHFAVILIFPFFVLLLFVDTSRKTREAIAPILLSALVPILLWVSVHGRNSLLAWKQMTAIVKYIPGPIISSLRPFSGASTHLLNLQQVNQLGGTIVILFLASAIAIACKALNVVLKNGASGLWRDEAGRKVSVCASCTLGALISVLFLIPWNATRMILLFPLIVITLAIGLSPLGPVTARLRTVVLIALFLFQAGSLTIYFQRLPAQWHERDSARYSPLIASIAVQKTAVVPPELWFAFRSVKHPVAVLYPYMGELRPWLNSPEYMDGYDVVILKGGMDHEAELTSIAQRQHTLTREWNTKRDVFHVFIRPDSTTDPVVHTLRSSR